MAKDNTIGDNIRKLRDSAGYSQQSIAGFLKVDQSLISKIEKGERGISSDMLDKLASLFGIAASAILDDTASALPLARSPDSLQRRPKNRWSL